MNNPFTTKDPLLDIINQVVLGEKKLTDAELKKREEIAKAMERDNPGMDMGKKMAIATAQAKKVAEEIEQIDEDKAQYRYTGGMHGEYHPTKKQSSPAAHIDAAKFHEREAKIYSKALGKKGGDDEYANRAIDFHTGAAYHHRNSASAMKEEVELDEAATRKEVKKVYSKKGNHIGTVYNVDNGKDKPFISAHYHPGGFMNNSLSLKSHEDAEKWIHHSHSSHLEHAKARHDEAKLELRQHEKHLKSIPESVEQINEISAKTLASAARAASDPDADYAYDKSHDADKFAKHATKKFGSKIGAQISKAASGAGHFPKEYGTSGKQAPYHGRDKLADRTPSRVTAAGKANKQDVSALKNKIKNEEIEQIDEAKKTTHEDPLITVHKDGRLHAHAHLSTINDIHGTNVKHTAIHAGGAKVKTKYGDNLEFKLSKWHGVKEEAEQIDEVDMGQAERGMRTSTTHSGGYHVVHAKSGKVVSKHTSHGDAIRSAMKHGLDDHEVKAIHEEVEHIDEISKKTLGNYVAKAVVDVNNNARWGAEGDDKDATNKAFKRLLGVKSAASRLSQQAVPGGRINHFRREEVDFSSLEINESQTQLDAKQNVLLRAMAKDPAEIVKMRRALGAGDKALGNPMMRAEILKMLDQMMNLTTSDPALLQRTKAGLMKSKRLPEEVEQIDEGKTNHNENLIKYADKKLKGWNKTVTHNTKKTKTNDPHTTTEYHHPVSNHVIRLHHFHSGSQTTNWSMGTKHKKTGEYMSDESGQDASKHSHEHIDTAAKDHKEHMKARGIKEEAEKAPFEGGREVKSSKPAADRVKKIAKGMQKRFTEKK